MPERWRRNGNHIQIYVLRSSQYELVEDSPTFPGWQLQSVIPEYVEQSRIVGRNKTMRAFRAWIQERLV